MSWQENRNDFFYFYILLKFTIEEMSFFSLMPDA